MAFISKLGNVLKQNVCKNLNSMSCATTTPSLFQSIRSMSSSKIFIGGLSYNTDDVSLREAFNAYGEVIETKIIMDRETGRSRGFGFVSFTSGEDASKAIQAMDGQDLHGRRVRVNYATDRVGFRNDWGSGNTGYGGGNTGNDGYGGNSYDNRGNDGAYGGSNAGGYGGNGNEAVNFGAGSSSGDIGQGDSSYATGGGGDAYGGSATQASDNITGVVNDESSGGGYGGRTF